MDRRDFLAAGVPLFLLSSATGRLLALPQQPPAAPPEAPRLPAAHRPLAFLLGQWEEEIRYAGRDEAASRGRGRWRAWPELGHFLAFRYEGRGPEGEYRAIGLLTWDGPQQAYRMWWFDDSGGVAEYRGQVRDAALVLEHLGQVDSRPFRERITYTRISADEVRTTIEQAYGTDPYHPYLDAVARRRPRRWLRPPQD